MKSAIKGRCDNGQVSYMFMSPNFVYSYVSSYRIVALLQTFTDIQRSCVWNLLAHRVSFVVRTPAISAARAEIFGIGK